MHWCIPDIARMHGHGMEVIGPASQGARPVPTNSPPQAGPGYQPGPYYFGGAGSPDGNYGLSGTGALPQSQPGMQPQPGAGLTQPQPFNAGVPVAPVVNPAVPVPPMNPGIQVPPPAPPPGMSVQPQPGTIPGVPTMTPAPGVLPANWSNGTSQGALQPAQPMQPASQPMQPVTQTSGTYPAPPGYPQSAGYPPNAGSMAAQPAPTRTFQMVGRDGQVYTPTAVIPTPVISPTARRGFEMQQSPPPGSDPGANWQRDGSQPVDNKQPRAREGAPWVNSNGNVFGGR